jgi:ectoine hydroxylase-related dioxygenase (phytanoyl-CoA dioxygenase family)
MSNFRIDMLDLNGFAIVPAVLDAASVLELQRDIQNQLQPKTAAGVRSLASKVESVRLLSQSPAARSLVEPVLGTDAKLVRSIFFNKSNETNWHVAWHQDLSIAVEAKHEVAGFNSWSIKDGVHHVQPPREVLENMLTVRLHLDAADESNGALWVSPCSHRLGRLSASDAATVAKKNGKRLCSVEAGDALILRPLLLHASRKASADKPRRVIHLEYSGAFLPPPLQWAREA